MINFLKIYLLRLTIGLLFGLLYFIPAPGQTYQLNRAEIVFSSRTQIERFDGVSFFAKGTFDASTGRFQFAVPVDSIATGNSRRDAKMKSDYLRSSEFPYIMFDGTVVDWQNFPQSVGNQLAEGIFSIAGNEKQLTIPGTISFTLGESAEIGLVEISSTFEIRLSDFNIERPRFLFVRVDDAQQLRVWLELQQQRN